MFRHIYNFQNHQQPKQSPFHRNQLPIRDYGPNPFVVNIEEITKRNRNFRSTLWTGNYLQLTLMSLNVGEDIGWEMHPDVDQFLRIEDGEGLIVMGDAQGMRDFEQKVEDDFIILIPAGKWHNLFNTGNKPLKLYSLYAPPNHPYGTIHQTKQMALQEHNNYH